jgi:hypothetical protein
MAARTRLLPLCIAVTLAGATPGLGSLVGCRGPAADEGAKVTPARASNDTSTLAMQMRAAARLDDVP